MALVHTDRKWTHDREMIEKCLEYQKPYFFGVWHGTNV